MQNKYKGILLYVKSYKENDLFIKFLSNSDELISGIVYGGLSKKKRNIFQIGFYLNFDVLYKNNRPASINGELCHPFVSSIISDKYKLNCLLCVTSLINLSIIEGQKVNDIYKISNDFLELMFFEKKWFKDFCLFLFKLLKIIGYEIDYSANTNSIYFDLEKLEFCNTESIRTIKFPYNLLDKKNSTINLIQVNQIFKIFENVFEKNHLSNFNLHLPNQFLLFKKLIIQKLNRSE